MTCWHFQWTGDLVYSNVNHGVFSSVLIPKYVYNNIEKPLLGAGEYANILKSPLLHLPPSKHTSIAYIIHQWMV